MRHGKKAASVKEQRALCGFAEEKGKGGKGRLRRSGGEKVRKEIEV